MKTLITGMLFSGSVLMLINIIRYYVFVKELKKTQRLAWKTELVYVPFILMILFLVGYILVGIIGKADLLVTSILLGGSIFVCLMLMNMFGIVAHVKEEEQYFYKMEEEKAANAAKTVFLSNMSHDIRTPLNAIIGFTRLARETDDPARIAGYLERIDTSSEHLLSLINDILEMSRIESGKIHLQEEAVDVNRMLDSVRDLFSLQMREKNIAFTVEEKNITDPRVIMDRDKVNRVAQNLVSNAGKFTPEGGQVQVRLEQLHDEESPRFADRPLHFRLTVKDTGIGMQPEFAEKVFEAFERERTSTVSGIQGTGLGMAITKRIVDLMEGEITVITEPGRGTEFAVELYLAPAPEAAPEDLARSAGDGRNIAASEGKQDCREAFSGKRLLLAEDVAVNREIALMLLTGMGFTVDTAQNGQEAVEMLEQSGEGTYQAVLMDIQMPVMDGYEAARRIRKMRSPYPASVPIIAMTANAFEEDRRMAREAGMDAHVAKPVNVEELRAALTQVICGKDVH